MGTECSLRCVSSGLRSIRAVLSIAFLVYMLCDINSDNHCNKMFERFKGF